ncbi:uncharacterized protein LOC131315529 isoform X2 [Rhododendron vialii]|uniref:uncharacterized protein LOC131315529 isoform X2 n=1 Tax=Rhododendron vialii TaxID=182163 RepID=UPI00265FDE2A|nr:uncharacterized protein LOC131315529 isoform X2 [Rhododendron vialii]
MNNFNLDSLLLIKAAPFPAHHHLRLSINRLILEGLVRIPPNSIALCVLFRFFLSNPDSKNRSVIFSLSDQIRIWVLKFFDWGQIFSQSLVFFYLPKPVTGSMATPSNGGDSDEAIPQSLPLPSFMASCALSNSALLQQFQQLQLEDIVDQSPCSASASALLQQLQQEDIVDQSPCSASNSALLQLLYQSPCSASNYALLQLEPDMLYGYMSDASDMSGPTDFSGATSSGATWYDGSCEFNLPPFWDDPFWEDVVPPDEVEEVETRREGRGEGEMEEGHLNSAGCLKKGKNTLGYDEVEEVETRSEGRGEGEMEEGHLNSAWSLKKGKRKVRSPRGERGNKKTTGARIEISLDDILQVEKMRLQEAARHLKVSASTLKRVCREHGICRWPPRMGKNHINQSGPSESLLAVDQEGIAQQRPDTPRSSNTNSVIIKARYVNDCTIKFRLSRPWVMVELEQRVQKRLKLEAGTYYIKYKDEDNDLIIIACDEDLQDYISSSIPQGSTSIEVLLVPK